ncbi:Chaperone [Abeliophyllum distichum]|uniref:Chaperone n=1 Tax=Abeliophyllum distichum TaxID=126358 RepID=A0ABD1VC92_9LAMI
MDDKEAKITLALGNSMFSKALVDSKAMNQVRWLLIRGNDLIGKRRLALGIEKSMFVSSDLLVYMNMRMNMNTQNQKLEMLEFVLVEEVDFADPEFVKFLDDRLMKDLNDQVGKREVLAVLYSS